MTIRTVSATDFKANCMALLDRLAAREIERLVVTKGGKPVAELTPPPAGPADRSGSTKPSVARSGRDKP